MKEAHEELNPSIAPDLRNKPERFYVPQFATADAVEQEIHDRETADMNQPQWNWCGICCVQMILRSLGDHRIPSLGEMYERATNPYRVYRVENQRVVGAYHKELARYIQDEFALSARTERGLTLPKLIQLVREGTFVIASVAPDIRQLNGPADATACMCPRGTLPGVLLGQRHPGAPLTLYRRSAELAAAVSFMLPKIAILTGGTGSEREIALASAAHVQELLRETYDLQAFDFPPDIELFFKQRRAIDLVIPLFHGVGGEDGSIQGFLQTLGIPFLFSDVAAQAIAMNKATTKDLLLQHGIKTASYFTLRETDPIPDFSRPCVIKPIDGGSSIGVAIAKNKETYLTGIKEAFISSDVLLIEDYIPGKEFTVAVIEEGGKPIALPVIEIRSKNTFFDLASKYDPSLAEELCPAPIDDQLAHQLQTIALRTHQIIGAKHLSRTDIIVDDEGTPWVLEINTIPGQTENSLLPKAACASGRSVSELYQNWILSELNS